MGRAKQMLLHAILKIASILSGFILAAILAPIIVLINQPRHLLYSISVRTWLWKRRYTTIIKGAILFFYLELAIGLPYLAVRLLGINHLFDGIVTAGLLLVFFAIHYPKILPPALHVTYTTEAGEHPAYYHETVEPESDTMLFFFIRNLGSIHLSNCGCSISLEEGFKALGSPKYVCETTSDSRIIQYTPRNFEMSLPPLMAKQIVLRVKAPKETGDYKISFTLYSESSWGNTERSLVLRVAEKK